MADTGEPRLKSRLRVQAMLRRAQVAGQMGAVLRRGDADAGAVLLVLRAPAGLSLFSEATDGNGQRCWMRAGTTPVLTQQMADDTIARQVSRDPDLWVVEIEAASIVPAMQEPLLDR